MSYSRWTTSRFYTYWCADTYADEAQLMIDSGRFHARVSYPLCKLRAAHIATLFAENGDEYKELKRIMREFCADVERGE